MPTYQEFRLPDAGEGLTEAEIANWLVAEGDTVKVNDPVVEVETAKSMVELPCPYAGVIHRLLAAEGQMVEVGAPILQIDIDPDGPPAADGGAGAGAVADGGAGAEPGAVADGGPAVGGRTEPVAAMGHSLLDEATRSHLISAGRASDAQLGHSLIDDAGRSHIGAAAQPVADSPAGTGAGSQGEQVLVGYGPGAAGPTHRHRRTWGAGAAQPSQSAGAAAHGAGTTAHGAPGQAHGTATEARGVAGQVPGAPSSGAAGRRLPVLAKPPVRKLARELGLDLATITPTGPGGIVTREDVLAAVDSQAPQTLATYPGDDTPWLTGGAVEADGRQTRVPVRSVRKRTADAMVASAFTAPHVTVFETVDVTRTMKLVERLKKDREFADVRLTPLLIAAKALVLAVRRHPEINASWDSERQEIVYKHYVNLGIAAATPRGLVVPNIKDAHRMGLHDLALALADLTATARAGKTSLADMSDGTITITNVGVFGIATGTPILNPGESAILAFGAITKQPWVHKGKVRPRWVTQLALSFDHRLVDGELGSRVLADVAAILADPAQGLVWG